MSINAAIDNKCEQQEIKEAYQTAMDGFEEAPVLNEEIRLREKAKAARKRFYQAVSAEEGSETIKSFTQAFGIAMILALCGITKNCGIGISAYEMFTFLVSQVFCPYSIYRREQMHTLPEGVSTSSVSRFLRNPTFRWETFLSILSAKAVASILKNDKSNVKRAFAADDSDYDRKPRGKYKNSKKKSKAGTRSHKGSRTEFASKKFDHARKVHSTGFRTLTLSFVTKLFCIPMGFFLLASTKKEKIVGDKKNEFNKNSWAYKRREFAVSPTMVALNNLIVRAMKRIKNVKHLCVDRWFSNPAQIYDIMKGTGLQIITVLKHCKTKYLFNGHLFTIAQLNRYARKHFGSKELAELMITVPSKGGKKGQDFQAKVVFVRNQAKKTDWIAILSTDTSLSATDIIEYYSLRWKIETFFWTAKKFLGFNDECHSTSYDAMTAHMTIVTVRYIILVIEQCKSEDKRTMGTLFAMLEEEQKDKEIGDILGTFCDVMFDALESANLTEKQMEVFVNEFMSHLPSQIFKYLTYASTFKDEDEESTATKRRKKRA